MKKEMKKCINKNIVNELNKIVKPKKISVGEKLKIKNEYKNSFKLTPEEIESSMKWSKEYDENKKYDDY